MLFKNKVLLAKTESTYGTDSTPAATDAVLTKNLKIVPYGGNVVSRDLDRSSAGAQTSINTGPMVSLTFDVEIAGSGTAGTAPAWAEILMACAFEETIVAVTSAAYTLVSPDLSDSLTIKYYIGGQEHKVLGARGSVSFSLARGAIPTMSFNFIGLYATPTAVSNPTPVTSDYISPVAVTNTNTPTFTVLGTAVKAESMSVDLANNVVHRDVIGDESVFITDRNANGSMIIEAPAIGTKDWFSDVESHAGITTGAVQLVHGTTAGNIATFDGPAVQLSLNGEIGESEGIVVYDMSTSWTPSSGNDEFSITLT